jgi:hypothetical protein
MRGSGQPPQRPSGGFFMDPAIPFGPGAGIPVDAGRLLCLRSIRPVLRRRQQNAGAFAALRARSQIRQFVLSPI